MNTFESRPLLRTLTIHRKYERNGSISNKIKNKREREKERESERERENKNDRE